MRIDLFLRLRRNHLKLKLRLRVLAGGAAFAGCIVAIAASLPAQHDGRRYVPLIVFAPSRAWPDDALVPPCMDVRHPCSLRRAP